MTETNTPKKTTKKVAKKAPVKKTPKKSVKKVAAKKTPASKTESTSKAIKKSFKNDLTEAFLKLSENCKANLEVQSSKELIEECYVNALKEVSKNISIPGFRKGKVPKELIKKNYASHIEEQQNQLLVQRSLEEALKLAELRPLNMRQVKPKLLEKTAEQVKFAYEFETYPLVESIDIEKIKLKKIEVEEVPAEKIEEVIDVMRSYKAKWERVENRAAEKGDYVELDIVNLEDGNKLVSGKRVQIKEGRLSKWIMKLVVGMKKDETKKGTSSWDETLPQSDKKDFKPTKCSVTVKDILTAELPELNEDFAKSMGTQSLAELKTQVVLRLNKNAQEQAELKTRDELDDKLCELVDFDIPSSLIEAEKKIKIQMREDQLKQAKFSDEDIKNKKKETEEESLKAAIRSLKLFFIFQKIAQDHNIIVEEKELQAVLAHRLGQLNLPQEFKSSPRFKNQILPEMRMNCFVDILSDKVKRHLLKKVSVA